MRRLAFQFAVCLTLYLAAFVVIHRSSKLRRPAYNMAYWYYSDNDALDLVEFYGFWPLRQIGYKVGFISEHISERKWSQPVYPPDFKG